MTLSSLYRFYVYVQRRKHYSLEGGIEAVNAHAALSVWLGSKVKAHRYRKRKRYAVATVRPRSRSKVVKANRIEPHITYLYWGW